MAISNFKKEQRRETIEQALGIAVIGGIIAGDYAFVSWLAPESVGDLIFGMLLAPMVAFLLIAILFLLAYFAHALGEVVCAGLAKLGADPRPTQRYR